MKEDTDLLHEIINKNFEEANAILENCVKDLLVQKLFEMKKIYAARLSEQVVNKHGRVETATGEMILPSVYRHIRLNEAVSDWERPSFQQDSEKAMEDENRHATRRGEEIKFANLGISPTTGERTVRGPQNIVDHKKRRGEYFTKAADAAVRIRGDDVEAAARHMHGLVTSIENQHEPWMVHRKYDDLTKNDFEGHIRKTLRDKAKVAAAATDPAIKSKLERRSQKRYDAGKRKKEQRDVEKYARERFLAQKEGKPVPESPWNKKKVKVDINDEIPFLEEKVMSAIDKAFSKKVNNGKS